MRIGVNINKIVYGQMKGTMMVLLVIITYFLNTRCKHVHLQ